MKNKLVLKIDDSSMALDYSAFAPKSQFAETGVTFAQAFARPVGLEWDLYLDSRNVRDLLVKAGFAPYSGSYHPGKNGVRVPFESLVVVVVSSRRARRKVLKTVDATGILPGTEGIEVA